MILTCEHGGNEIPREFEHAFKGARGVLNTHRGLDIGALDLARRISKNLGTPLTYSCTSRLLVDLNRSLESETLFSEFSKPVLMAKRERILARYYHPYRKKVEARVAKERGFKLHLSVHSFTPVLQGKRRECEIGILFDPARKSERTFAMSLRKRLAVVLPAMRVRFNYPYKGTGDGFTASLRERYPDERYAGIELEIRQDLLKKMSTRRTIDSFAGVLSISLGGAAQELEESPRLRT